MGTRGHLFTIDSTPLFDTRRAVKWAGLFCVMVSLDLVVDSPIQPKALHPIRSIPIDVDAMAAET